MPLKLYAELLLTALPLRLCSKKKDLAPPGRDVRRGRASSATEKVSPGAADGAADTEKREGLPRAPRSAWRSSATANGMTRAAI